MRRYTVRLHDAIASDIESLRQAIDRRLFHAPVTYSFGRTATFGGGSVIEVATDVAPDSFERLIAAAADERQLIVDVSRGWLLSGGRPDDADDSLARIVPEDRDERSYDYRRRGWLMLLLSPLVLVAFVGANWLRAAELLSRDAALIVQAAVLFGVAVYPWRLDFWRLVTRIEVDRDGLTVVGFRRRRYAWSDVWGLDLNAPVQATIRAASSTATFPLDRSLGLIDQDVLLRTIVERASLRLAETHPPRYRRSDSRP